MTEQNGVERSTATDELRRMLDERGVEWTEGIARPELTQVRIDGKVVKFHPWQPNTLKVSLFDITPEQAIAAILGSSNCSNSERTGTCHDLGGTGANGEQVFDCSECGCVLSLYDRDGTNTLCTHFICDYPRYCPECGRKVVWTNEHD